MSLDPTALRSIRNMRQNQKDLVCGYIRTNSISVSVPFAIMQLTMIYAWILEEWDDKLTSECIKIIGINHDICKCEDNEYQTIFGRNVLYKGQHKWTLKLLKCCESHTTWNIMIGIIKNKPNIHDKANSYLTCEQNTAYSFIGQVESTQNAWKSTYNNVDAQYGAIVDKTGDIIEMYLDLRHINNKNNDKHDTKTSSLNFVINNIDYGACYENIDTDHDDGYRLGITLSGNGTSMQILNYENSQFYLDRLNNGNKNDPFTNIGYARSLHDVDEKLKHYEIGIRNYDGNQKDVINEWHNEYLRCLITKQQFQKSLNYIIEITNGVKQCGDAFAKSITPVLNHYYKMNDFKTCFKLYSLLTEDATQEIGTCFQCGYCCYHLGDYKNAIKYYKLHLIKHPEHPPSMNNLANMYLFQKEFIDYKLSKTYILKALEINSEYIHAQKTYAHYLQTVEKNYCAALEWFKKVETKDPNNIDNILNIASVYEEMKQFRAAVEQCQKGFNVTNQPHHLRRLYGNYGYMLFRVNDLKGAVEMTRKSLEYESPSGPDGDFWPFNNLGYYLLSLKQYDESRMFLEKAMKINSDGEEVNGTYGNLLFEIGEMDQCAKYWDISLTKETDVENPDIAPKMLWNYGLWLFQYKKNYKGSIEKLMQLVGRDDFVEIIGGNKHEIYWLLCRGYNEMKDFEKALEFVIKAQFEKGDVEQYDIMRKKLKMMVGDEKRCDEITEKVQQDMKQNQNNHD